MLNTLQAFLSFLDVRSSGRRCDADDSNTTTTREPASSFNDEQRRRALSEFAKKADEEGFGKVASLSGRRPWPGRLTRRITLK